MRKTYRGLFFSLLLAALSSGQGTPSISFTQSFTMATSGGVVSNGPTPSGGPQGAVGFRMVYYIQPGSGTVSSLSLELDGASTSGGSYTALTPAVGGGSGSGSTTNPVTTSPQGQNVMCCDFYPYLKIKVNTLTVATGTPVLIVKVLGYAGTSAAAGTGGGGGGGGTIEHTTDALKGDGAGNAVSVTGAGTNCVLVNGGSTACGGASFSIPYAISGADSFGLIFPMTVPPSSMWTWVNQNSATVSTLAGGALTFSEPFGVSPDQATGYVQAIPGALWTITAAFRNSAANSSSGIMLYDSVSTISTIFFFGSDGKFHGFNFNGSGSGFTFNSRAINPDLVISTPQDYWMRVSEGTSTRTVSLSVDGLHFQQIFSESAGSYVTATHIGIGFDSAGVPLFSQFINGSFVTSTP